MANIIPPAVFEYTRANIVHTKIETLYEQGQDSLDIAEQLDLTVESVEQGIDRYLAEEDLSDDAIGFSQNYETEEN